MLQLEVVEDKIGGVRAMEGREGVYIIGWWMANWFHAINFDHWWFLVIWLLVVAKDSIIWGRMYWRTAIDFQRPSWRISSIFTLFKNNIIAMPDRMDRALIMDGS
jgi:hypothetical protein